MRQITITFTALAVVLFAYAGLFSEYWPIIPMMLCVAVAVKTNSKGQ